MYVAGMADRSAADADTCGGAEFPQSVRPASARVLKR